MKGAVMQESFGCAVANRFCQLLDDDSDPFDILREAESRRQQRKQRGEAAAAAKRGGGGGGVGGRGGAVRRESQKERKQQSGLGTAAPLPGQKRAPKQGEEQAWNDNRRAEKQDKTESRPSFREYRSYETERQTEFTAERSGERVDYERPRGRGRGRGGMRGRGRGSGISRSFDGFDQRGKREFERQSGNDKTGVRADDKKGGSGARNWGTARDDLSEVEQTAPVEETAETAQQQGTTEGEPLKNSS